MATYNYISNKDYKPAKSNNLNNSSLSFQQKVDSVLTDYQKALKQRATVTKSLIYAIGKAVLYKKPEEVLNWVGKDTEKFIKVLPLISSIRVA